MILITASEISALGQSAIAPGQESLRSTIQRMGSTRSRFPAFAADGLSAQFESSQQGLQTASQNILALGSCSNDCLYLHRRQNGHAIIF